MINVGKRLFIFFVLIAVFLLTSADAGEKYSKRAEKEKDGLSVINQKDNEKITYTIQRLKGPITLDGLSDEQAWKDVTPFPMVMHMPTFGNEPSERTEVLMAHDDDYLYIAGRMYDSEPDKIQATSKKRDFMQASTEWFGVIIDTFNDNENGLGFFTTPTGLRFDATVFNDAVMTDPQRMPINISWNTFWDVEVQQNDEGWFAEFRIPFSSLRFQDTEGRVVMGFISWRYIPRKNEGIVFPAIPPNWGWLSIWKPSQAQDIVFESVYSRKPLYITPYILGGYGQSYDLNDDETAYDRTRKPAFEGGLDLKYGLTSNITLDLTVNTDFAQVEADDVLVNLTRFSLFFPEKRLFFQERSSIFEFSLGGPNRLFYSRQIGIYEGESVRIYGGARLIGRVGNWDVGFLNMQTAPVEDEISTENFGVLRLRRRVFNPFSYIGGILTTRIGRDGSYNVACGLDGIFRIFGDDYVTFTFAQTFEDGMENKFSSLNSTRFGLGWERRTTNGLGYNLNFSRSGRDFNPGIGFVLRDDYSRIGIKALFGWLPGEKSFLLSHNLNLDGFVFLANSDNQIESAEIGPGWEYTTKKGGTGNIALKMYRENVTEEFSLSDDVDIPVGKFTFYGLRGSYATPMGGIFMTQILWDAGSFYDGWRVSITAMPRWSISADFYLNGVYQINWVEFPDRGQKFLAHIVRFKFLATLTTKFEASAFIQYNSLEGAVIGNIRLRYNPREGNDLYIVYNEVLNTNRHGKSPFPPVSANRAIMIKFSYTFNL